VVDFRVDFKVVFSVVDEEEDCSVVEFSVVLRVVFLVVDLRVVFLVVDLRVVFKVVDFKVVPKVVVVVVVDEEEDDEETTEVEILVLSAAKGLERARLLPDLGIISEVAAPLVEPPMDADEKKTGRPGRLAVGEASKRTKNQPTAASLASSFSGTWLNK
jgi:hypothetical protein